MTQCAPARSSGIGNAGRWLRLAVVNTLAAITVAVMFTAASGRPFASELISSLIFSHTIGGLAGLIVPAVSRRLNWDRGRWARLVLTATLLVIAPVGCGLSPFIVRRIGLVPAPPGPRGGGETLGGRLAALPLSSLAAGARHGGAGGGGVELGRPSLGMGGARLGDRLRCAIELPLELESCLVPPLALHTLV